MTFSFVTACVPVTLFLSLENKVYFFSQRFNVITVDHKTKCGIGEDIPQYQLAFNYFADKNSTVNKKESKMKKANRNKDTTYLPWRKLTPVYPCCVSLLCIPAVFNEAIFLTRRHLWEKEMVSPDTLNWTERPAKDYLVVFLTGVFFRIL